MIKSYLTIAFRAFRRGHIYSFINLFGLAVGLAGVMLIISYVFYELSFDKHYKNSDRIYQLVMENRKTSPIERNIVVPVALGPTLKQEFPEVEAFTNLNAYELTFLKNDKPLPLNSLTVSPDFFETFNFNFLDGNRSTVFKDKSNVVITAEAASKLFPDANAMGKSVVQKAWNGKREYFTVSCLLFKQDAACWYPQRSSRWIKN